VASGSTGLTVRLVKQQRPATEYFAQLLRQTASHLLIHARWDRAELALPYVTFCPGDHFFEHYYIDWWFNIHEVRTPDGQLKGWYCNSCRPVQFEGAVLVSEDLELDLFVAPDFSQHVLDQAEFKALSLTASERATALTHFRELKRRVRCRKAPFNGTNQLLSLGDL
jgi:protein associated with RNAse G/E